MPGCLFKPCLLRLCSALVFFIGGLVLAGQESKSNDSTLPARQPAEETKGQKLYKRYCLSCHGKDGQGTKVRDEMPAIPDFTKSDWFKDRTDSKLSVSILDGKGTMMPAFEDRLDTEQVKNLLTVIRAFANQEKKTGRKSENDFDSRFKQLQREQKELFKKFEKTQPKEKPKDMLWLGF